MQTTMRSISVFVALIAGGLLVHASSHGQELVKEPSTEKSFPAGVKYTYAGTEYPMDITGVAVRKKFLFKVYGLAHYMQDPPHGTLEKVLKDIMTDGKAKQLTMVFVRDVDQEKIRGAYRDGFEENAGSDGMAAIKESVNRFVGFFDRNVKENDVFILRWLPGGIIMTNVCGDEKPAIVDQHFASTLWSIWFGENSIVDREDLVSRLLVK
jgi:hypothetical protein